MGDMDDMNNAPMPPMDDGMGMDDPNMMGGDPNAMGSDPNMDGGQNEQPPMDGSNMMGNEDPSMEQPQGNDEENTISQRLKTKSAKKYAGWLEYGKSMLDDDDDDNGMMPESRRSYRNIIDETINSIIYGDDDKVTRPETRLPKRYRGKNSPFNSPFN